MKAVVAAFNQEKALVGAFSVITNLRMELFEALAESDTMNGSRRGWAVLAGGGAASAAPHLHGDARPGRASPDTGQ